MNTTQTETWKLFKTNPYYRKTNVWIPDSPKALYQTSRWFISDHGNVSLFKFANMSASLVRPFTA